MTKTRIDADEWETISIALVVAGFSLCAPPFLAQLGLPLVQSTVAMIILVWLGGIVCALVGRSAPPGQESVLREQLRSATEELRRAEMALRLEERARLRQAEPLGDVVRGQRPPA